MSLHLGLVCVFMMRFEVMRFYQEYPRGEVVVTFVHYIRRHMMAVCLIPRNVNSTTWLSTWLLFLSPAFHGILLAALIKTSLITRTKHFIKFSRWFSAPGANSCLSFGSQFIGYFFQVALPDLSGTISFLKQLIIISLGGQGPCLPYSPLYLSKCLAQSRSSVNIWHKGLTIR